MKKKFFFFKRRVASVTRVKKERTRSICGGNNMHILKISKEVERSQVARLRELKSSRDNDKVKECLAELTQASNDGRNLMPVILDCARNNVTLGEMCNELKEPFGIYEEQTVF